MIKLAVDNTPAIRNFTNKHGNRWFFDPDIKELFGLKPKDKWPDAGMPVQPIQGIFSWVEPRTPGKFKIRAKCQCFVCGKTVAIGRLAQHNKVHK